MSIIYLILKLVMCTALLLGVAYVISTNRKIINIGIVIKCLILQLILAVLLIKVPFFYSIVNFVASLFVSFLNFSHEGASFLFGNLVDSSQHWGFIFAFQVLPTIIFFSAITTLLYHLKILQKVVYFFSWMMCKIIPLSGRESLAAIGNVFLGQTEAPLLIKPYLSKMSKSELLCLMSSGMATIAGSVLVVYMGILGGEDQATQILFGTHLLSASILSAPAAIMFAKIICPEDQPIDSTLEVNTEVIAHNSLDAISKGTQDGLNLAINIGAILLVFVGLIALINSLFGFVGEYTGLNSIVSYISNDTFSSFKLQSILGILMAPIAWLLGAPGNEIFLVGQLLGEKTIINEFVAYLSLADMNANEMLSPVSVIIAVYALCGFSNLSCIGIQITNISILAPNQRKHLCSLGWRALVSASLACLLTAVIAVLITSL